MHFSLYLYSTLNDHTQVKFFGVVFSIYHSACFHRKTVYLVRNKNSVMEVHRCVSTEHNKPFDWWASDINFFKHVCTMQWEKRFMMIWCISTGMWWWSYLAINTSSYDTLRNCTSDSGKFKFCGNMQIGYVTASLVFSLYYRVEGWSQSPCITRP